MFIANTARSFLIDAAISIVEEFNFIGGKQINYALKNSYEARCAAAVISHSTKILHSNSK